MSVLEKLTEGIVNRDLAKEGAALLEKWDKTGLLEGIGNDTEKGGMARLLENQAKELLREASTMASGDVEGFASVAFPLVRRVFGSLIANDLVSVQPMSLPSGLIFFLDFTTQPKTVLTPSTTDTLPQQVAPAWQWQLRQLITLLVQVLSVTMTSTKQSVSTQTFLVRLVL